MKPFDAYPGAGQILLGRVTGDNCRRGYGRRFMVLTGQRACAYCSTDLSANYEAWLTMALDHVVPRSVGRARGLLDEWMEDFANRVLACAACNGFANRYKPTFPMNSELNLEGFFALRDRIFEERKVLIAGCHGRERRLFHSRPWE